MRKTLWHAFAGNLVLFGLAFLVSCSCLCGKKDSGETPTAGTATVRKPGQDLDGKELWRFVVSGDSRNCGDVVMPAIAKGARKDGAQFYWHLGDLRAIYDFDDDMLQAAKVAGKPKPTIIGYEGSAWDDFIANQAMPFGDMRFYLGIGNHEVIPPKSREQFVTQFADWLDTPTLQKQRLDNDPTDHELKAYYHWREGAVDFIYLDNASADQFDKEQLGWLLRLLKKDAEDPAILTVVVGMHKALPWSVSCDHSMNESGEGERSGVKVYKALLELQKKPKNIYVLASHSHYFMEEIFNNDHWANNGGILEGWIVGTAGAQRYPLPLGADPKKSRTNVYGYLLGTVDSKGRITFKFTEVKSGDIPLDVKKRYTESWIRQACFDGNRRPEPTPDHAKLPEYCTGAGALEHTSLRAGESKQPR